MERIAIFFSVNSDALKAMITTSADNTQRNLATVSNQHAFHRISLTSGQE
jgi:hypothetical protein